MSRLKLPYNGESVPSGYQASLDDHQLSLLNKLLLACKDYDEEGVKRSVENTPIEGPVRGERFKKTSSKQRRMANASSQLTKLRSSLPSFKKRSEILKLIAENQVVIIAG